MQSKTLKYLDGKSFFKICKQFVFKAKSYDSDCVAAPLLLSQKSGFGRLLFGVERK